MRSYEEVHRAQTINAIAPDGSIVQVASSAPDGHAIMDKINEIIDYLNNKEEKE